MIFSDNRNYVNYDVDMLYPKRCKNRYADQVQDAVLLASKKLREMPKNPPRASNRRG